MSNITATGRHSFAKTQSVIDYPDFLDIQIKSFQDFFQLETAAENRTDEGLFKVFAENFPIADSRENFVLSFVDYSVDPPKYSVDECIDRGLTYSVPLKAKLRLICNDTDNEDFQTIEQEVFLGNIPYMTERGSFVINGAERVIVSQLHRSPGVFFAQSKHTNGTKLYSARIIPFKGLNWYNPPYVIAAPGYQVGAPIGWSGISNGWEDARYRLDVSGGDLRGTRNLRFRMAFAASPNTVIGNLEGFAFDNFYIGNRTRSVLVEHFTNQNVAGIANIERDLYSMIYGNLYGRDVNLVQFHTEYNSFDFLHQQSIDESNSRVLFYGINNSNQVRINGQSLVSNTTDLVYWAQEILDMQMLQDAKFKIKLYPISIQGGNMTITADVTAKEDILYDDYALHVVVTEDSIISLQGHRLMSVVRTMRDDASGTTLPSTWVAGDLVQNQMTWDFGSVTGVSYNPNNLKVVVFVQNRNTGEVYQVATSRNLNIFNGPVSFDEIAAADGKEIMDMNLYPNPAQNMFNVEFNEELQGEYEWKVVDVTGRILRRGNAQAGTKIFQVNTENFSPGMYIFSINNETVYAQRKVIIAK